MYSRRSRHHLILFRRHSCHRLALLPSHTTFQKSSLSCVTPTNISPYSRPISRGLTSTVIETIQQGIIDFQVLTTLPWYASIATSTILVRLALLPITRQQMIASHQFSKALPEISLINELLKRSLAKNSKNSLSEKKEAINNYISGFQAALKIHNVSFTPIIALPLVNLSVFVTFIYAIRGLILYQDFEAGGTLWFEDLQDKDSTLILPGIAMCATYTSLQLSFKSVEEGTLFAKIKDILQTGVLLSLPLTSLLPCGIFCYWIPSSLAIITQMLLLRQPAVLNMLSIPAPQKPSSFRMPDVKD